LQFVLRKPEDLRAYLGQLVLLIGHVLACTLLPPCSMLIDKPSAMIRCAGTWHLRL
jgi:hypothetical protein